jgi:CBS domain-containing protein
MKSKKVKDLMVPLSEYATISQEATLYEAIMALEKAQQQSSQTRYPHRAILVLNKKNRVVGKVSLVDVLRALEPKYSQMGEGKSVSRLGFSAQFLKSLQEQYKLFSKPIEDICRKASQRKVKDFMSTPSEGEYIEEDESLDAAIHTLVMGSHQSLLVTKNKEIVGILKIADVYHEICDTIKACNL